jgi:RNA exonuclease 1
MSQAAQQPSRLKAAATDKATSAGTSTTMKTVTTARPLKRPLPDSPSSPVITKADPLKRPKTTTAMAATTKATAISKPVAQITSNSADKPARLHLNPRPLARLPAAHGVRIQFLQLLQKELTRLSGNPKDDASQQAIIKKCLDLEEEVAITKPQLYRHAIAKLCARYKKATPEEYRKEQEAEQAAAKAKETPMSKAPSTTKSHLDNAKPPLDTGLSRVDEIIRLRDFVASPEVLKKHGYILTPPTKEEIQQAKAGVEAAGGYEYCERCTTRFQVFPGRRISDGELTSGGTCTYHPGRRYGSRPTPGIASEQKWACCNRTIGLDPGCKVAKTHVFKVTEPKRLALTFPFSETPSNPNLKVERALALDCEMSYTTHGMELTRITATAFPSGKIVIDALVMPYGVVLDFNTQFSGVSSEMMTSAPPWKPTGPYPDTAKTELINPTLFVEPKQLGKFSSPAKAREALYSYIGPETTLIGHALENDLLHLRMCHQAVVDTAVLFPHTRGLPLRNKLKYLVEQKLGREIQVDGGDSGLKGHDSAVDARCSAELVRWKIREAEQKKKKK